MRKPTKLPQLFILCLVICFLSSCEWWRRGNMSVVDIIAEDAQIEADKLEVGQIWRYYGNSRNNPFESEKDSYQEIIDISDGWVQYKENGTLHSCRATSIPIQSECTNCR